MSLGWNRYGKGKVSFLRVDKDSDKHVPHEFVASIMLHGPFTTAFTEGTNESVLPTETQKNTLYALSKKYPVEPVERWAVLAAKDVMERHKHIEGCEIEVTRLPWHRVTVDGKEHNHCFLRGADGNRFAKVGVWRDKKADDYRVTIAAGFKGMKVMKTTQSGFEGYIVDEYTTLKPTRDRILATEVMCEYTFSSSFGDLENLPFTKIWEDVRRLTIERFAGPPEKGIYSPSVQQTIYDIGCSVLQRHSAVQSVKFALPNIHYYQVDFSDFRTHMRNDKEVFLTFDGAHGQIEAEIVRPKSKL